MADAEQSNLTTLTVDLLSAYVTNNSVEHGALSELIKSTHAALKVIDSPEAPAPVEPEHKPAVSVRKSLGSRTHIVSMIDGKSYQTLKRHLAKHGLTPKEYRERYKLPSDYPMVAPAYSESRREIAERLGLGRRVTGAQASKTEEPPVEAPATPKKVATSKVATPKKTAAAKAPRKAKAVSTAAAPALAEPAKPARAPRAPRKAEAPKAEPAAELAPAKVPAKKPAARKRPSKAAPAS